LLLLLIWVPFIMANYLRFSLNFLPFETMTHALQKVNNLRLVQLHCVLAISRCHFALLKMRN